MTVSSLWTVLDDAGCGKAVGANQMVEHKDAIRQRVNPWTYNELSAPMIRAENRMALAVDLSIWICEALTSTAMSENHAEPALHLVFARTTRLLSMGIKLVVVIEGKRRIRGSEGERDSFRKRRSGTAFWKACKSCEEMLRALGVPVVKAKAEGEALCALLNQRGIVDGVISNDGDCLLFGAKVVYTRFSLDNLDKSLVIRYDVSELRGCLDKEENNQSAERGNGDDSVVSLERGDLISFALLTGSDLAGDGLPKVGHKKAIRFIKQCKIDYPLTASTAAIDELKSWARTASAAAGLETTTTEKGQERCCSLCCHPGDKRSHQKHGCEICGTQAGEPCFASSAGDKFRNSLRLKALAMVPKFDPSFVMEAYMNPNDNQVPIVLLGETARTLRMTTPSLVDMLKLPHIVKGQSLSASKDYVKKSVARLLARSELANHTKPSKKTHHASRKNRLSREKPVPTEITRKLVHNKTSCYEISWVVKATATDGEGNEIDGYEFSTIEPQELVEKRHKDLVQRFTEREKEAAKQGDAEANRRRDFVSKLLLDEGAAPEAAQDGKQQKKKGRRAVKQRATFFEKEHSLRPPPNARANTRPSQGNGGDDVHKLMAVVNDSFKVNAKQRGIKSIVVDKDEQSLISELTEPEVTETDTNNLRKSLNLSHQEHISSGEEAQSKIEQRNIQEHEESRVSSPPKPLSTDKEHFEQRNIQELQEQMQPSLETALHQYVPLRSHGQTPVVDDRNIHEFQQSRVLYDPPLSNLAPPMQPVLMNERRDEIVEQRNIFAFQQSPPPLAPSLHQLAPFDVHPTAMNENHKEFVRRRNLFESQESQTPLEYCLQQQQQQLAPFDIHPATRITNDEFYNDTFDTNAWKTGKKRLFQDDGDDYLEPSRATKRRRWSMLDPVVDRSTPVATQDVFLQRDFAAATPVSQFAFTQRHYYSSETSQEFLLEDRNFMEEALVPSQQMPVLTPGRHHSMVCDMGIKVEITPLISSTYF